MTHPSDPSLARASTAQAGTVARPKAPWTFARLAPFALLTPGLLALLLTFGLPIAWLVVTSITVSDSAPPDTHALSAYKTIFSDKYYWGVLGATLKLGFLCAVMTVILSYPLAMFLARTTSRWRGVLVALAISPLLTSMIVRTYGWMVLLNDNGVINGTLRALHLIDRPLPIANNFFAAAIAITEILMPYAVLAMMSGFGRISRELEHAAAVLGASPIKVFLRVILPLSLPGVATAALLVFVLSVSSFVTPQLMGGGRVFVLATEVFSEATVTLNWQLAAALSMVLLVIFGVLISLYQRAIKALEY